ncbi:hypothetical protein [Streptomyces parvus]
MVLFRTTLVPHCEQCQSRAMHTALPTAAELYGEGFTAVHHPGDATP